MAKTPTKKKADSMTVGIITDVNETNIRRVVVVAPGGHTEGFDNRVYQCLVKGCGNRGSVNEGHFHRVGSDTICNSCGGDFNRWVREAAV